MFFCLEEKTVEVFFERYLLPWEKKPAYLRSDYGRLCVCVCVCVCVCAHVLSCFSCRYLTLCNPTDCTHQAPVSMGFSRQEHRNGLPCPPPGDLPNPGIECAAPATPALDFFSCWASREALYGRMDISKSSQALGAPDVRAGDNVYCDVIIICTTTDSGGTNPFSCPRAH